MRRFEVQHLDVRSSAFHHAARSILRGSTRIRSVGKYLPAPARNRGLLRSRLFKVRAAGALGAASVRLAKVRLAPAPRKRKEIQMVRIELSVQIGPVRISLAARRPRHFGRFTTALWLRE
jgi:hypothetical protein